MSNKFFLGVGINNYPNFSDKLCGCINDIEDWYELLNNDFGFEKIKPHLFDDKAHETAILESFIELLDKIKDDESTVGIFVCSCHGADRESFDTYSEPDGYDEGIQAYTGMIFDDDFRKIIDSFNVLKGKLICIFDTCYSGTVTDLNVSASIKGFHYKKNDLEECNSVRTTSITIKKPNHKKRRLLLPKKNNEILISSCLPDGLAYEKTFNGRRNGVFSRTAINVIKKKLGSGNTINYTELITKVNKKMNNQESIVYGGNQQRIFTN